MYPDVTEAIPPNMPASRGESVQINCFVDASHAGDAISKRSRTGILIYLNMTQILWYCKAQNTIKNSTFDAEFVALRIAVEILIGLRYKLRMFGIPLDGPCNVFCDNETV